MVLRGDGQYVTTDFEIKIEFCKSLMMEDPK